MIRPRHWVVERVIDQLEADRRRRARTRRALGIASHRFHTGSRSLDRRRGAHGRGRRAGLDPAGGPHPLPAPDRPDPPAVRPDRQHPADDPAAAGADRPDPGPEDGHLGFTLDEMTDIAREGAPRDRPDLAVRPAGAGPRPRLDEHEQSARVGPRLRRLRRRPGRAERPRPGPDPQRPARPRAAGRPRALRSRPRRSSSAGSTTPATSPSRSTTWTSSPNPTGRSSRRSGRSSSEACDRNAHERCRRFCSAPLTLVLRGARQHVEGRAEDLAQVRPEWGHATNAITHRRPARMDPRPVPRPPGVPDLLRSRPRTTPRARS